MWISRRSKSEIVGLRRTALAVDISAKEGLNVAFVVNTRFDTVLIQKPTKPDQNRNIEKLNPFDCHSVKTVGRTDCSTNCDDLLIDSWRCNRAVRKRFNQLDGDDGPTVQLAF